VGVVAGAYPLQEKLIDEKNSGPYGGYYLLSVEVSA
jgi:hypothetical protein